MSGRIIPEYEMSKRQMEALEKIAEALKVIAEALKPKEEKAPQSLPSWGGDR